MSKLGGFSPRGTSWITKHHSKLMLQRLFEGKIWECDGEKLVIHQDSDGVYYFSTLIDIDGKKEFRKCSMTLDEFLKRMSKENLFIEQKSK